MLVEEDVVVDHLEAKVDCGLWMVDGVEGRAHAVTSPKPQAPSQVSDRGSGRRGEPEEPGGAPPGLHLGAVNSSSAQVSVPVPSPIPIPILIPIPAPHAKVRDVLQHVSTFSVLQQDYNPVRFSAGRLPPAEGLLAGHSNRHLPNSTPISPPSRLARLNPWQCTQISRRASYSSSLSHPPPSVRPRDVVQEEKQEQCCLFRGTSRLQSLLHSDLTEGRDC